VDGPPSWRPAGRDVVVAGLAVLLGFLLFSAGGPPAPEPGPARSVAMVALAVAMGAPLAWRRRSPEPVAAVVLVAGVGYAAGVGPVPPFALWFALFAVVVHTDSTRRSAVAGALVGLGTVGAVVLGPVVHGRGGGGVLATVLLTVVVALAGALVRTEHARHEALRQRAASLERERDAAAREAAVEERLRIARDLHDLVGHGLSIIAVQSSTARLLLDGDDHAGAHERLRAVEATSRTALREMRSLLGVLREEDATRDPSPGLADLGRLVESSRADGLDATLVAVDAPEVPAGLGLAAYRIVQESLTNVRKHAPGASASVAVAVTGDALEVTVLDTGGGRPGPGDGGHGLLGIRERVASLGGTVTAGPCGPGWQVRARLPLRAGTA
jgi:signal transduction histidine kinase